MSGIASILAATDFSTDAGEAVQRAVLVARTHGATLKLLHVLHADALDELRKYSDKSRGWSDQLAEDAQQRMQSLVGSLRTEAGIPVESELRTGKVLPEVLDAADEADLLVVGAQGQSRARDVLLGTLAERALLKCTKPVLVVKHAPAGPWRRVLVPVDFSNQSAKVVRFARQVAPHTPLTIFHAYENPYEGKLLQGEVSPEVIESFRSSSRGRAIANLARLQGEVAPDDTMVTTAVNHGDPKYVVAAEANREQADLIVIGKRGRSLLSELFLGGVTRATLARAGCDVLVVPERS